MSIKVIILRKTPPELNEPLKPLLINLRSQCMAQPGYISGETLMNADDPTECLVISSWEDENAWNEWLNSEERGRVQHEIDELLGEPTRYQIYYNA